MKTISEMICILCLLFTVGVAGGLERGLVSIAGAFVAWGAAALIAVAALVVRARA